MGVHTNKVGVSDIPETPAGQNRTRLEQNGMNSSNTCDWHPGSPISDSVWAQAIYAVAERRLSLRQASQTFGLQQTALHRLVRRHAVRQALPTRAFSPTNTCAENGRLTALAVASTSVSADKPYVLPPLNPLVLGNRSPNDVVTAAAVRSPLIECELTPEINEEVVSMLRMQFKAKQHDSYESGNGCYDQREGYADADIADAVRAIVGHTNRHMLPLNFPSASWLAMFKRENGFLDLDDRSCRTNSRNCLKLPTQHQQPHQFTYGLVEQQRHEDHTRQAQNRNCRQPAAPPPLSPLQRSPIQCTWYIRDDADGMNKELDYSELSRFDPPQHLARDESKLSQSPESCSSSDRKYRQSNLVPAKVWEAAMEDVVIHGMSLRNAAKAHGVHFAALHRRLKKRQQHKVNRPCEPNYIPFEDEAGVVRVIHARAEMGVLLTFTELVDLLKRTALKHRSSLPEDVAKSLVRRFQSRVEQSVRHLVVDWPALPNNILQRETGGRDSVNCMLTAGVAPISASKSLSIASGSSGGASISSSGSPSSLSPHPQSVAGAKISPGYSTSSLAWSNVMTDKKINDDSSNIPVAIVSPSFDDSKTVSRQSCTVFRL